MLHFDSFVIIFAAIFKYLKEENFSNEEIIQGRKLFKGENYSRKTPGFKVLFLNKFSSF